MNLPLSTAFTGLPQEIRKNQINNLTLHLKQLEKEEMENPRVSQQKERNLKNQGRNKYKRNKRDHSKNQQSQSWFFERINKIDKPLARLIKNKGRKIKSTKLEMKMERSQQTTQKYKG